MFIPTDNNPANPPEILVVIERYLISKGYEAKVVYDSLYRRYAIKVVFEVPDTNYFGFFILDGESLVYNRQSKTGATFPLGDPDVLDKLHGYLDHCHNTISRLAALQHQYEDVSKQSD